MTYWSFLAPIKWFIFWLLLDLLNTVQFYVLVDLIDPQEQPPDWRHFHKRNKKTTIFFCFKWTILVNVLWVLFLNYQNKESVDWRTIEGWYSAIVSQRTDPFQKNIWRCHSQLTFCPSVASCHPRGGRSQQKKKKTVCSLAPARIKNAFYYYVFPEREPLAFLCQLAPGLPEGKLLIIWPRRRTLWCLERTYRTGKPERYRIWLERSMFASWVWSLKYGALMVLESCGTDKLWLESFTISILFHRRFGHI